MNAETTAKRKVECARFWAMLHPHVVFYGSLASNLTDTFTSNPAIPTAATDGKQIFWNVEQTLKWSEEEVRFVLLHETLHCAHAHFARLPRTQLGNIAGDYAINWILRNTTGLKMPEGGLLDVKYSAMAEEEILKALKQPEQGKPGDKPGDKPGEQDGPEGGNPGDQPGKPGNGQPVSRSAGQPQDGRGQPQDGRGQPQDGKSQPQDGKGQPQDGKGQPGDPGKCGGFIEPAPDVKEEPGKPAEKVSLKERWERNVLQADLAARSMGQGNAPGDLQAVIDRLKAPAVLDWRQETAEFVKSVVSDKADWTRSARRFATAPCIYPRRRANELGVVVFVEDTSGSVVSLSPEFRATAAAAQAETGCEAILLQADARVQSETRITIGEEWPTTVDGGGGTDFRPAFTRVQEMVDEGEKIAGVVYITDLYGTEPAQGVADVPTLWLCINDKVAGFGRTVRIHASS